MDYEEQLEIAEEFPQEINHIVHSETSNILSSPINSANRFFKAFPSDFKKRMGINHFQNMQGKAKISLITPKNISNNSTEQSKVRSIKQFLQFQKCYADERERKIYKLKQEKEKEQAEECKNTPTINSHSRRLTSHLESTCYQRLSREKPVEQQPEIQFHPKILNRSKSMNRKQNVSDLLYDDAQRRIQKQKILKQQVMNANARPRINTNTDKLVIKTLKSQYQSLVKSIQHVNIEQVLTILNVLFNTNFTLDQQNQYTEKSKKIISYLCKGNKQTVSTKKLWSFIQVSNGCKSTITSFNQKEQKQITKQFKHFLYRNRMHKQRTKTFENEPTFRPQILKNSQRLAQRKRDRMITHAQQILQKQNVKLNVGDSYELPIADLYILERMHNQEENRIKKQKESNKQFEKCTFRPQLTKYHGTRSTTIIPTSTKSSRARQFFNRKNTQNMYQNTQLTNNTMQSFQYYNLNNTQTNQRKRSGSRGSMNKSFKQVKNLQSSVFRMSAGRKQKQFSNKYKQRGYPKDIQNWQKFRKGQKKVIQSNSKQRQGYKCSTPSNKLQSKQNKFVFDIYISNGILETISLDKDSDIISKVQELQYKYNLNQEKKIKLIKMIKSHLFSYLEKEKQNTFI